MSLLQKIKVYLKILGYIFQESFGEHEHFYICYYSLRKLGNEFSRFCKKDKEGLLCFSPIKYPPIFVSCPMPRDVTPLFCGDGGYKGFVIMTPRWERTFIRKNSPTFPFSSSLLRSEKFPRVPGQRIEQGTSYMAGRHANHLRYAKLLH